MWILMLYFLHTRGRVRSMSKKFYKAYVAYANTFSRTSYLMNEEFLCESVNSKYNLIYKLSLEKKTE